MKTEDLSTEDVIKMPLAEFESRFGFRPCDALEKKHFAICAKRLTRFERDVIETGILGDLSIDGVVME